MDYHDGSGCGDDFDLNGDYCCYDNRYAYDCCFDAYYDSSVGCAVAVLDCYYLNCNGDLADGDCSSDYYSYVDRSDYGDAVSSLASSIDAANSVRVCSVADAAVANCSSVRPYANCWFVDLLVAEAAEADRNRVSYYGV